jgi:hypothetical protein
MSYEHFPPEGFRYIPKDGPCREKESFELNEPETLPISDILRFMSHEKFILSGLIVLGIGKALVILKILQII